MAFIKIMKLLKHYILSACCHYSQNKWLMEMMQRHGYRFSANVSHMNKHVNYYFVRLVARNF